MKLSKKQQTFLTFKLNFQKLHQILNISKQKMTLIAYVFPKLLTVKNMVK